MKLFFEMLTDNIRFIIEGKGIKEKTLRLLNFTLNFIVMTGLMISMKFRGKK